MKRHVALGVAGWDWPTWSPAFYPSGMPEEWRLSYFNTQFECVFLAEWRQADPVSLSRWAEDTHEAFLFLLEDALPEELPACLAGRALGVARTDLLLFDRESALRAIAKRLSALDAPRFLISSDGDLGQIEKVRTLLELLGL